MKHLHRFQLIDFITDYFQVQRFELEQLRYETAFAHSLSKTTIKVGAYKTEDTVLVATDTSSRY